jgi:hypothetical protein
MPTQAGLLVGDALGSDCCTTLATATGHAVLRLAHSQGCSGIAEPCLEHLALHVHRCGLKAWPNGQHKGRKTLCAGLQVVANVTGEWDAADASDLGSSTRTQLCRTRHARLRRQHSHTTCLTALLSCHQHASQTSTRPRARCTCMAAASPPCPCCWCTGALTSACRSRLVTSAPWCTTCRARRRPACTRYQVGVGGWWAPGVSAHRACVPALPLHCPRRGCLAV